MANESKILVEARRTLGAAYADGNGTVPARASRFGEQIVLAGGKARYVHCDGGEYFVATNPTNGTGIAGIAATGAFSDAESLLVVYNTSTATEGKRIYLDHLKLRTTAAGANGTDVLWVAKIDSGDRRGTGGSAITAVNTNMDSSTTLSGAIQFGAVASTAASTSARLVGQGTLRITIGVVNDTTLFDYGGGLTAGARGAAAAADSTNVVNQTVPHAPVVLGPGQSYVLSVYHTAQTAASSYEFELGLWQR